MNTVQRDQDAQMAIEVLMALWRHGFVVYRRQGQLFTYGYAPNSQKNALALVKRFHDVLLPRTPSVR